MFDDEPGRPQRGGRGTVTAGPSGRSKALLITGAVLLVAFLVLTGLSSFWTERLWFVSVDYGSVFTTLLVTRIVLFAVFGLLMALVVALNMWLAYRYRPTFRPPSPEQTSLERYREAVAPMRKWLVLGIALLMGAFAGTSGAGQWRNYLLWRNGGSFDRSDPYFDLDAGFYVFDLPAYHYVVDFTMAAAVVGLMAAAVVHYLYGGIRLQPGADRLSGAAQVQLSVLLGVFVLAKGVDYWIDRYDLLTDGSGLITGMTYTAENAELPAKEILAAIAVICAVLFFVNVWRRTWILPGVGLGLLLLSAILLGLVWPGLVQRFQVLPTEADREEPYIQANIDATRDAYQLEDTVVEPYSPELDPDEEPLAAAALGAEGIRLVDPAVVPPTFEQSQQVRGYYSVPPVLDVDRYPVNGVERDMVLGVRELNQSGISEGSQNWQNLHTVYTHGYGVIAAFGNQRPASNDEAVIGASGDGLAFAEQDLPPRGELTDQSPDGYEGRIYFGENSPSYSIVGKASEDAQDVELDLPSGTESEDGSDATNTYDGADGVSVGNLFNQLLYAVKFGEPNIVLSGRVNDNSKILYDRDPALRVEKVAPWLTVDSDPFPAVIDGRVQWILDGYTLTDRFPQSEKESFDEMTDDSLANDNQFQTLPTDEVNYIRNAVKATVDAYDGTVTLYAWDESDPMLQAWMGAFPGTVQPRSEISDELLDHLRYPEDMFKAQRYQLAPYHVTDASDFYEANDRWEVPADPNDGRFLQPPYRLSLPQGGGRDDVFSLTSVYTPVNRENLASFVSVDADAADDNYGTIRIRRLPSTSQVPGPAQIANAIGSDTGVTELTLPLENSGATVVRGNLLTIPVAGQLLYVQPIYALRSAGEGNFPVLRYVAVSFGQDRVGVGETLGEALYDVLGLEGPPPDTEDDPGGTDGGGEEQQGNAGGGGEPTGTVDEQIRDLLDQADQAFSDAQDALDAGDLQGYQEANDQAQSLIEQAIELSEGQPSGGAGGDTAGGSGQN
ncbi:UPF0182 family protein [Nocardioides sp. CFH 31398]|uniref:UPF0182 family membrane protein n=1 Tax=Nocardioides sp. CFH 31398 TaxID=2919579 RepID=UPI001F057DD3|nr:UPF0182 family protein [Nocardioides sp. CFH 31398]MCH1866519.1 UPF0182 family protein [Nocardioides sp. CFH 31398]